MSTLLKSRKASAAWVCLAAAVYPASAQFSPALNSPFTVGHNPVAIVSADFNRDFIPDLAIANQTDNSVAILIGDGRGGFTPPATGPTTNGIYPAGTNPSAIASGDFNNDGKPDLAIANINGNNVTILFGDGAGGFTAGPTSPATGKGPAAIAVADFDGDGKFDIATANLDDGTVTVLFGDGTGAFPRKSTLPAGKFPIAIIAADLNADGIPDLVVANEGDGTIIVVIDPFNGVKSTLSLTSAAIPTLPTVTQSISAVAAGNFTGHPMTATGATFLDLAVTYYDNTSLQGNMLLFVADEKGGFKPPSSTYFPRTIGLQPVAIATGIFSLGGTPGVAIANYRSNTVGIYAGDGTGNLTASKNSPYATGVLPRAVAVADFNGDGLSDVAVANYNDGTVTVLLNTFSTAPNMLSAASDTTPVAPGSLVSIYGTGLASPANPNGTTVTLTDSSGGAYPMQILFSSPTQLSVLVPQAAATGPGSFSVTVPVNGSQRGSIAINSVAPGLFSANASSKGPAAAYIQSLVTSNNPIPVFTCSSAALCTLLPFDVSTGTTSLVLYGTGLRNRAQVSAVQVTVGGVTVPVFYAGPTPGTFGVDQINVALPASLAHAGTVFVQAAIGSAMSNQVTVAIQ